VAGWPGCLPSVAINQANNALMPTRTQTRHEPCTSCGEAVTTVELTTDGLGSGRLVAAPPTVYNRHTERSYAGDLVDQECTRSKP
jgi:hypothetical protein